MNKSLKERVIRVSLKKCFNKYYCFVRHTLINNSCFQHFNPRREGSLIGCVKKEEVKALTWDYNSKKIKNKK